MREILFKAKRKDNGEWEEGDLVHDCINAYSKIIEVGIKPKSTFPSGGYYPVEVIKETVCQLTEKVDKEGTKLFEGDVVRYDKDKWFSEDVMLGKDISALPETDIVIEIGDQYDSDIKEFCVKIGNVHDEVIR